MLNLCGIVVAILKMAIGRNFSMSGINSGHYYLPIYQILMISENVEFLPPSSWSAERKEKKEKNNNNKNNNKKRSKNNKSPKTLFGRLNKSWKPVLTWVG